MTKPIEPKSVDQSEISLRYLGDKLETYSVLNKDSLKANLIKNKSVKTLHSI